MSWITFLTDSVGQNELVKRTARAWRIRIAREGRDAPWASWWLAVTGAMVDQFSAWGFSSGRFKMLSVPDWRK